MSSSTAFDFSRVMSNRNELLAPVVQTLDSAIHRINQYPADKYCYLGNQLLYGHWIKIYPSDSATTLWTTGWSMFATWKSLLKCARSMGDEILQQKNLMLIMCISSTEIYCKTVRIFAYSSTREQSNEAENREKPRLHGCGHIFWMDKNVHGSAFRLHDTRGAVQVFDLIRIKDSCKQNCNL